MRYVDETLSDSLVNRQANLGGVVAHAQGYRVVNYNGWYVRQELVNGEWKAPVATVDDKQGIERFRQPWQAGEDYHRRFRP